MNQNRARHNSGKMIDIECIVADFSHAHTTVKKGYSISILNCLMPETQVPLVSP
jgi:hypothetical protein